MQSNKPMGFLSAGCEERREIPRWWYDLGQTRREPRDR